MKTKIYLLLISLFASSVSFAQTDTINFTNHKLITANLKPGLRQYMVFFQMPAKKQTLRFSLWARNISIEKLNGGTVFVTSQHWYGADTTNYRTVRSINRYTDFSPVYHAESIGGKLKAYNWSSKNITGADTTAGNLAKDFTLAFDKPNLNWNLDIETFEMLPLGEGKTFAINFYDAGSIPPAYVIYNVTGSEVLTLNDNTKVDCWKLSTMGKAPDGSTYTETFWISKKNHEFLKEEDAMNGMYRYKIKLMGSTPDFVKRFN